MESSRVLCCSFSLFGVSVKLHKARCFVPYICFLAIIAKISIDMVINKCYNRERVGKGVHSAEESSWRNRRLSLFENSSVFFDDFTGPDSPVEESGVGKSKSPVWKCLLLFILCALVQFGEMLREKMNRNGSRTVVQRSQKGTGMRYTREEVIQYIAEEDVKFIRLAFCDIFGRQKNVSIVPEELMRAFSDGIAIDASAISGFGGKVHSDLFLRPDPSTLSVLPWRPENGKVVRMYCQVFKPDGTTFEGDTRHILGDAVKRAKEQGIDFAFGSEMEFYLFRQNEQGEQTKIPYDQAGYMDVAPEDKGENVRREICLTLERMGIRPESSHHEEGPGQNEIDFRYSDPETAADDALTFQTVVRAVAARNGLCADFSPKPHLLSFFQYNIFSPIFLPYSVQNKKNC